jgi:choline-sulfatase
MSRPNILIFMVDQLSGTLFPNGPAEFLHVPNLRALATRSARFVNTYTASPLCAPARAALMSGQLPSRTRVYDNAAEFAASVPTFAHHLRRAGYRTVLSGKMHFVGPDQLHGFEERLTTDIYPADFGWTPDYRKPGERIQWWYHNLGSVTGAGVAEISNQMEYDDEVAFHGEAEIYRLARRRESQPWCLTVSFSHPHDPYVARRQFWDLYEDCPALEPEVPEIPSPSKTRTAGGSTTPATTRASRSARSTSAARAAPTSPTSPISTRRSGASLGRCSAAGWRRTRSSSSAPTTATCWASGGCGLR